MDLSPGARLGPYEVVAPLGSGGMGVVYRARDSRLNRSVALKVLRESVAQDRDRLRRFETEARAAGALNHPNIVAVFDTGTADGVPYVVSELLDGETLRDRLTAGALRQAKALEFAIQIAEGLGAAHERHVVHRDLKPENLFVTKDGRIKILDFGLAKLRDHEGTPLLGSEVETRAHATEAGTVLGTVGYMSPEQVRGMSADHRSDIFSFGAVLFEMLTGKRAFKGETSAETMTEILRSDPIPGVEAELSKNPGLLHLMARCLEKKPEDRFQSGRDLAFHLRSLTESSGFIRSAVRPRRRLAFWSLVGVALFLGAAAIGVIAGRSGQPSTRVPIYKPLDVGRGAVWSARFGPDGATVYYSMETFGHPMEIFSTWLDSAVSQPIGVKDAKLLAVSSRGDMAVLLHPRLTTVWIHSGTLAQVSVSGGVPRELVNDAIDADFSPDGKALAVVRWVGDHTRLEFPMGRTLYEPAAPAWISNVRVSPKGDRVAFTEHEVPGNLRGSVSVADAHGTRTHVASGFAAILNVVWTSDQELQFEGTDPSVGVIGYWYVVRIGEPRRRIWGMNRILDLAPGGRVLTLASTIPRTTVARRSGAPGEVDLSDRSQSFLTDISANGQIIVGTSQSGSTGHRGDSGGAYDSVYLQRMDAIAPVRLGDGQAFALSPDQKWVLARLIRPEGERLVMIPTGAGESRELPAGEVKQYAAGKWFPAGNRVIFSGTKDDSVLRLYVQDLLGGNPQALGPDGFTLPGLGPSVSPDGIRIVALGPEDEPVLFSTQGGEPIPIARLVPGDVPIGWSSDSNALFYYEVEEPAARLRRLDLKTGVARVVRELMAARPVGMTGDFRILVTPDGSTCVFNYSSIRTDLVLVEYP